MFLATAFNVPFWDRMLGIVGPLDSAAIGALVRTFVLVSGFFYVALLLIAWPLVYRPVVTALLLMSSAVTYFMNQYGIVVDINMVRNVFETDSAEVRDLITVRMGWTILLLGVVPSWWLWRQRIAFRPVWPGLGIRLLVIVATTAVVAASTLSNYQQMASLLRNHRELRFAINPNNYIAAIRRYVTKSGTESALLLPVALDAQRHPAWGAHERPTVLILVIGETARAANFSLNGYGRATNPELEQIGELLNFGRMYSCGTETAVSLPCMFSNLGREGFDVGKSRTQENLLDVLARAGFLVEWLDSNSGCKGICKRVGYTDLTASRSARSCPDEECYDEILLEVLPSLLRDVTRDTVLVLHQKGNHGPAYYKRYPASFRVFVPQCETSELQQCSRQEIVNAYDNAIRYTDYILAGIVDILRSEAQRLNGGMIYVSDHGESLGERGLYLHGTPYFMAPEVQRHVPAVMWFSPNFATELGIRLDCLQERTNASLSHDNLFHSTLGLLRVQTRDYDPSLDLFAGCQGAA